MGNQNHGKMIDCQPEKRLVELMSADEIRDFVAALVIVKSTPDAFGKITLDIRNGKVKFIDINQSIKAGG